jgi:pimeloyl-ACP methyl ester carboxylesterase
MNLVLLPGLDGTSRLVADFCGLSGARVIEYPQREMTYPALADHAIALLPERPVLIAESFGGAIGVLIASRVPVEALVLCNSFVLPPLPRVLSWLPLATMARVNVPETILAALMTSGSDARLVRGVVGELPPRVLGSRIRAALSVDVRRELATTRMPLLDLRSDRDRLVRRRARHAIVAARLDARTAETRGPHTVLTTEAAAAWEVIRAFLLEFAAPPRPKAGTPI